MDETVDDISAQGLLSHRSVQLQPIEFFFLPDLTLKDILDNSFDMNTIS